ncbi:Folylpolyglutamate synthase [Enhygromyxa salina]|uniref:Dihydrofolate synthase/folylpolyglutamate synthase n=1 Tax=Enhygromyxa salina TaxID=215803 RepID=A0A2S9XGH3_9BACT|nr:cyanophycin synthetase [Enhygromyxa salina]PRP91968.1 Folylpolyglutamate synthase [Enhygromyxa salina]
MVQDWRAELFARRTIGVRLGTASMELVLDALLPGLRQRPPFDVVQIVGTNGKGSTAALIAHGLATLGGHGPIGLFTSPHLERIGERVRIDGQPLADEAIRVGVTKVTAAERLAGVSLSFFEVLTAVALSCFVDAGCRVVVLEAGLGGRLDATTAVSPRAIAIARVALDHQDYLGDTLEAIAAEKAAVIRAGVPVFSVQQATEAAAVIETRARERGARLEFVAPLAAGPRGLLGPHQRHNGALALAILRELDPRASAASLDGVSWPGRLERLAVGAGSLWLDVAHNLDGVEALGAALRQLKIEPRAIVFGAMADKPAPAMAARMREHAPLWLVVPAEQGAFDLEGVAAPGERRFAGPRDPELLRALKELLAGAASVVVCGSHYLVGALRAAFGEGSPEVDGPERSDPIARRVHPAAPPPERLGGEGGE